MKRSQLHVQLLLALAGCCLVFAAQAAAAIDAAGVDCRHGACTTAGLMPNLQLDTQRHRKLQQGWGGGFAGCAGKPLVIAYGTTPPSNIDDLLDNMESPLTNIDVASNRGTTVTGGDDRNVQLSVDPAKVELISLTDPASCIRTLTTVRGGLAIIDDGTIPDLSALSRVRSIVGPLYIYGRANASLTSLAGLESLQQVGGLNIAHTRLQNIAALSQLTVLQGDLVAWDNPALTSLAGLGPVTQMYGKLWIDANPLLRDLSGLQAMQVIDGDITLRNLESLASLNGLGSLVSTNGELLLHNLPRLTSTRALTNFTSVGISLVANDCSALQDLDGFARITRVPGDLQLYLLGSLPDLRPLAALQEVGLNLVVGANGLLTSLAGLNNVRSVGVLLSISYNPRLTSLQGLGNLQTIGQDLIIRGNAELTTLADLPTSLRSIGAFRGADVYIENNPRLATLSGLGTNNAAVYGTVTVSGNSPDLPASEVEGLKAKAVPVGPMTAEMLINGLPSNITKPAAAPAAGAAAAAAPGANASAAAVPAQPAAPAAGGVRPAATGSGAAAQPAVPVPAGTQLPAAPATVASG